MKLPTIVATLIVASCAAAPVAAQDAEFCYSAASTACVIAEARDSGVSIHDAIEIIRSADAPQRVKKVALEMAVAIYTDPAGRNLSPEKIGELMFKACIGRPVI